MAESLRTGWHNGVGMRFWLIAASTGCRKALCWDMSALLVHSSNIFSRIPKAIVLILCTQIQQRAGGLAVVFVMCKDRPLVQCLAVSGKSCACRIWPVSHQLG